MNKSPANIEVVEKGSSRELFTDWLLIRKGLIETELFCPVVPVLEERIVPLVRTKLVLRFRDPL